MIKGFGINLLFLLCAEEEILCVAQKTSDSWTKTLTSPHLTVSCGEVKSVMSIAVVTLSRAYNKGMPCQVSLF